MFYNTNTMKLYSVGNLCGGFLLLHLKQLLTAVRKQHFEADKTADAKPTATSQTFQVFTF